MWGCCCGSEDPASAKPLLSRRRLIGFGGVTPLQSIASRQVEKYRVGHFVQGLGPQCLTGTIVRIEASAPGQPPHGPGTLFVKTDDGGDDVTSVVPMSAARLAAGNGCRREILVRSRPMGIALHADPAGPTPTKLFKPAAPFPGLPVGSVLIEVDGKCVAQWHHDRVLEAIKGAQLPVRITFDTVLPPPELMAVTSVGGASTTTVQATAAAEQQLKVKIAAQLGGGAAAASDECQGPAVEGVGGGAVAASATPYPAGGGAAAAADPAGPAASPAPLAEAKAAATGLPVIFTLRQLESATNGFAAANKIAEGTFGVVYRGVLETGCTIAVKVLKREALDAAQAAIKQGREDQAAYMGAAGFLKELSVLGKYRHMNIVALLGFLNLTPGEGGSAAKWKGTFSSPPKQCLVLEFMPGGSLRSRLAPNSSERPLTAQERFLVASDIARGLEYLHVEADPTLLHQDVKTDNILLACYDHGGGNRICAKVSDFGTARYYKPQQQQDFHQTVNVVGTSACELLALSFATPDFVRRLTCAASLRRCFQTWRRSITWGMFRRRLIRSRSAWCCSSCSRASRPQFMERARCSGLKWRRRLTATRMSCRNCLTDDLADRASGRCRRPWLWRALRGAASMSM
jgi:hypothetical protein